MRFTIFSVLKKCGQGLTTEAGCLNWIPVMAMAKPFLFITTPNQVLIYLYIYLSGLMSFVSIMDKAYISKQCFVRF